MSDAALRKAIYDITLERGVPPRIGELAVNAGTPEPAIREGLQRLAAARIVVLQPENGELLMVPPFSAVPTPFVVHTSRYSAYANCAWDALGVPVMRRDDASIATSCGCCGESIALSAAAGSAPVGDDIIHFAVPARRWWDDVVFT